MREAPFIDSKKHPSPLFYDKTPLHSSQTNSYGLDPRIIERSSVAIAAEIEKSLHENILPCPFHPESKLNKTNTAGRGKRFINSEKELELYSNKHGVEYLPPVPGELPNSAKARRRKLKYKCSPEYKKVIDDKSRGKRFINSKKD